jgi:hypothetical protein
MTRSCESKASLKIKKKKLKLKKKSIKTNNISPSRLWTRPTGFD